MFFFINNTNNKCLLAVYQTFIGLLLAVSVGIPLDFCWLCSLEFHWFWSFRWLVCCQSIDSLLEKSVGLRGLPRNARTSSRKSLEKYCGEKAKKYGFCLPSVRQSLLRVHSEKQWECKDLDLFNPELIAPMVIMAVLHALKSCPDLNLGQLT